MKAKITILEESSPSIEAEAYALREASIWLEEHGLSKVVIEFDYLLVVNVIVVNVINGGARGQN
jgi:hypothetical protein